MGGGGSRTSHFSSVGSAAVFRPFQTFEDKQTLKIKVDFTEATCIASYNIKTDGVCGAVYKIIFAKASFSNLSWMNLSVFYKEQFIRAIASVI